jgi:hypothetical protein
MCSHIVSATAALGQRVSCFGHDASPGGVVAKSRPVARTGGPGLAHKAHRRSQGFPWPANQRALLAHARTCRKSKADFREWCDAAGLPKHCSAHGLRKAACRRLAEAGCSANEIAAISGHASLDEVARYTKAADQARLARNAMTRTVPRTKDESKVSNSDIV